MNSRKQSVYDANESQHSHTRETLPGICAESFNTQVYCATKTLANSTDLKAKI